MNMTNEEIVRDYRAAKSKLKQVGILADLNGCDNKTIVNILLEEGESVPGQFLQRGRKKAKRPELVELEAEAEERFAFDQGLKAPKESFELTTEPAPAIDRLTVAGLIEALKTMPQDVPIVGEGMRLTLLRSLDVTTGKFTESLYMEFTR